jgi:putative copper export protein
MHTVPKEVPPPPNDFSLLMSSRAWLDIGARFLHLVGFGIWLGTSALGVLFSPIKPRRFLSMLWAGLLVQVASGMVNMRLWTPFDVPPYVWNLTHLSQMRFGRSYALFMAGKHLLVLLAAALMMAWTVRYWKNSRRKDESENVAVRSLAGVTLCIGLVIGYIMIIMLLLHEGIDHAL